VLELTPAAAEVVRSIVSQTELPETAGMRITSEDGGAGANGTSAARNIRLVVVDAPEGDDVEVDGAPVYVEPGLTAEMLDDKVLDAKVDEDVVEFQLIGRGGESERD
jgi:iron-sulfur cluster assembly protein